MKLPIKKKYFDEIKQGNKVKEYRDAHITFVCEETGETLVQNVLFAQVIDISQVPKEYQNTDCLTDDKVISFWLSDIEEGM